MLTIKHLTKIFTLERERITALQNVDLTVEEGEFFTIIGPSGCGKSTLLRLLAGLDIPTSGDLIWDKKPKIGFVFQNFALFPYLNVFQNVEFGLKMQGIDKNKKRINR